MVGRPLRNAFQGSGPNILLLHGRPDDVRGWRAVAAWLQGLGYQTLAPAKMRVAGR